MDAFRRGFMQLAAAGLYVAAARIPGARAQAAGPLAGAGVFDVRQFGAKADGKSIDTAAINAAIQAAADAGGGTVLFPAGTYASYSIHLRSYVALHLAAGATLLAAPTPLAGTTTGGYDAAETNAPWEPFQDFGHNHWHNSLIWGEGIHDVSIGGAGLIWGKSLSRGHDFDIDLPLAEAPGVGNKAIALKNCHNVILRDVSILEGGHFAILATGVDNLTIDNLKIDTNRDGIDIDCCRNVRISNCTVNSPWDDGICPKSSFALGYARATENVTISNCMVTGTYEIGSLIDGTFRRFDPSFAQNVRSYTGRIKCGTESNGGFKNIAVSNCVFDGCRGFALETVDGGVLEDITFTGITMRDIRNAPFYLRLGARMRGPANTPIGTFRRVIISDVTCEGHQNDMPAIINGVPGHMVEDVKISNLFMVQKGGGTAQTAAVVPEEQPTDYPEPFRMGALPAQAFYVRHARNLEMSNVEISSLQPDARPVFWMDDVDGVDLFRLKLSQKDTPSFLLNNVQRFRLQGGRGVMDTVLESVSHRQL